MAAAVYAAAAVEFLVGMADVVDDLVDEDEALLGDNWKQHVNAAPPLAFLALACVHELRAWLLPERVLAIEACMLRQMLIGHSGESSDLQLEQLAFASEDDIHQMMLQKAGALVAMACQVGALLATDEAPIIEHIGQFGTHVGMVAQLLNDMSDIDPQRTRPGSDIQRRKKTLPIAYALRCAHDEHDTLLLDWANGNGPIETEQEAAIASRIRDLGGLHYAWVVAEAHQNEALRVLEALATTTKRSNIHALQRLIPPLRSQQRAM